MTAAFYFIDPGKSPAVIDRRYKIYVVGCGSRQTWFACASKSSDA
ncbi:MAG: hypothetical protein JWQ71_3234, partial [Pedosphaera sp.]|nr:hypothetical protein [Pedosphaera sp.]